MSNHKKYVKSLKPQTFITFDSDNLWDKDSGYLLGTEFVDESDNGMYTPAYLRSQEQNVVRPAYKCGQISLIENQIGGFYSFEIAPHDRDLKNEFWWEKAYIEIPYNDSLKFDKSWSVMFSFKKAIRTQLGDWNWDLALHKYVRSIGSKYFSFPIFKKGQIELYVTHSPIDEFIGFNFGNNVRGTIANRSSNKITESFFDTDHHVCMTNEYIEYDGGRYKNVQKLYWDSELIYQNETATIIGEYKGGNNAPLEFGGSAYIDFDNNYLQDRSKSSLIIDQIAIFDRALDYDEVLKTYKKIYPYDRIVQKSKPVMYYKFDENNDTKNSKAYDFSNMRYSEEKPVIYAHQPIKGVDGTHGHYGHTAVEMFGGNMGYVEMWNRTSFYNPTGDFTIDFHACFTSSNKGVLFSLTDTSAPFKGITLHTNTKNNQHNVGVLQLSISEKEHIYTRELDLRGAKINYNDGKWRHYAFVRRGDILYWYINSTLIDTIYIGKGAISEEYNNLYLFGLHPGNLSVDGKIQLMAFYNRALDERQLWIRSSYLKKYSISGRVTMNGVGAYSTLRVYRYVDGQLLKEQWTNNDGYYSIEVDTDEYVNLVALHIKDVNVRPRIVGAMLADEYTDLPFIE